MAAGAGTTGPRGQQEAALSSPGWFLFPRALNRHVWMQKGGRGTGSPQLQLLCYLGPDW